MDKIDRGGGSENRSLGQTHFENELDLHVFVSLNCLFSFVGSLQL